MENIDGFFSITSTFPDIFDFANIYAKESTADSLQATGLKISLAGCQQCVLQATMPIWNVLV